MIAKKKKMRLHKYLFEGVNMCFGSDTEKPGTCENIKGVVRFMRDIGWPQEQAHGEGGLGGSNPRRWPCYNVIFSCMGS